MKTKLICAVGVVLLGAVFAGYALGNGGNGNNQPKLVLAYDGPSIANTHAAPPTPAFTSWCSATCSPSVHLPVYDPETGRQQGSIYVWTKDMAYSSDGKSECFGEFVWYALNDGDLYTDSGSNGTCGAAIDPSLKQPTHITGTGEVLAGGGDGTIVGGTSGFRNATGTYTDRTFVEINLSGGANYYDQLFFSISRN
jgi:hypothetical protein